MLRPNSDYENLKLISVDECEIMVSYTRQNDKYTVIYPTSGIDRDKSKSRSMISYDYKLHGALRRKNGDLERSIVEVLNFKKGQEDAVMSRISALNEYCENRREKSWQSVDEALSWLKRNLEKYAYHEVDHLNKEIKLTSLDSYQMVFNFTKYTCDDCTSSYMGNMKKLGVVAEFVPIEYTKISTSGPFHRFNANSENVKIKRNFSYNKNIEETIGSSIKLANAYPEFFGQVEKSMKYISDNGCGILCAIGVELDRKKVEEEAKKKNNQE